MTGRHVLVVGGGITGLAAALRLRDRYGDAVKVTVVEQARRLGGKILTGEIAGLPVETGAETFLVRRPEVVALAQRVGLADLIRHPAPVRAGLYVAGELVDMPARTVMGVPADAESVAGVVPADDVASIRDEATSEEPLLGEDEDVSVGELARRRLGDRLTDRLVDPLLGGVYAGRADDLSLATTVPGLAAAARRHTSLTRAAAATLAATPAASGPVFGTVEGGLSRLVRAVADASGADIRLGAPVRVLTRTPEGWRAEIGATRDPSHLDADAVILAVPASPAARLLAPLHTGVAATVGELDYASLALVTLVLPAVDLPDRSGFLVPASEGMTIKAGTFFGRKWPHLAAEKITVVRMSIGRYGDTAPLRRDDNALIDTAHAELSAVLRRSLPLPVEAVVQRWGGALPQYRPGHLDRVGSARASLAGHPIELAGAGFDGVGIPACVASGQDAADRLGDKWFGIPAPV
ncbi:oxygen-dependent protoporphyrinogen oxidase [Stackebrandtia albiflava]|uniref:Coproporphyrinogen III oxidase n=1 Tax=Stackebrandtia albiflava TaxID=406432 RepID=A0A562VBH4_9ACTN|nr:protoporphyrinogen oxidase [Stackebrandtia albiflava]TWJ15235.1 oxygen-dependent protoporphyrinogen oxidase [Stackebrandtia albiflava]